MNDEKNPSNERIEVMMPIESVSGKYSNFFRISHTPTEFVLDFCISEGSGNAHHVSRVLVNISNIKSFVSTMQKNIAIYESNYNIDLPETVDDFLTMGIKKKD